MQKINYTNTSRWEGEKRKTKRFGQCEMNAVDDLGKKNERLELGDDREGRTRSGLEEHKAPGWRMLSRAVKPCTETKAKTRKVDEELEQEITRTKITKITDNEQEVKGKKEKGEKPDPWNGHLIF
jgi:hypothetical protein